jgi:hypothetical protein
MVEEKVKKVTSSVTDLSTAFTSLLGQLWELEADSKEVYEAAIDLYESVGQFIETLEDLDDNLDPEKSNLPDIDFLFEEHPVTDYINAVYNRAVNEDVTTRLEVLRAAKELGKYQHEHDWAVYEEEEEEDFDYGDSISLYEYIKLIDEEAQDLIEQNLNIIEFALEGETEFTAEDIELLRYYFKQRPDMSDYEVDELSDRAIELAWKAEQYKAGKL